MSLTLHGESLSRHGDVVLALCGEAVMREVVVLWKFHQRVICGGQRLEKVRTVDKKTDKRSKQQDPSAVSGVDKRCDATLGRKTQAGLVVNNTLCKKNERGLTSAYLTRICPLNKKTNDVSFMLCVLLP